MTPLKPAVLPIMTSDEIRARAIEINKVMPKFSVEETIDTIIESYKDKVYLNDIYQVNVREHENNLVHLSIKRIDKKPITDWRDKQAIKNQLVGPECEGVELYPAESRCVDTANQYHLWCIKYTSFRFPFGWSERLITSESGGGSIQRPHENMEVKP